MKVFNSLIIISILFMGYLANGQTATLYYNQYSELTISEMATHFRVAEVDSGRFVGDVRDFRMDSTLIFYAYYGTEGIERFYHINEQQDTLVIANSIEDLSALPDSISTMNIRKEKFDQAKFIRKNDYPLIRELLSPLAIAESELPHFTVVEAKPEFPGGQGNMIDFLSYFITYPDLARENGITGKVYVEFIIEKDGTLSNIKTIKGIGAGCDEAAEYAISKLPDWRPGYQRGKPVKVRMTLPVTFQQN